MHMYLTDRKYLLFVLSKKIISNSWEKGERLNTIDYKQMQLIKKIIIKTSGLVSKTNNTLQHIPCHMY